MAIDFTYLNILNSVRKLMIGTHVKGVCLSYPDLLVSHDELVALYGIEHLRGLEKSSHSDAILDWHKPPEGFGPIYETSSLFERMGIATDYIDIQVIRGPEKVVDLNEPLPTEFHGQYDLVIDTGTLEHCFNVGAAFKAMCQLSKVGGYTITVAPLTQVNHGFWNFNPGTYVQGFEHNGFEVMWLRTRFKAKDGSITFMPWPEPMARRIVPAEAALICVAKKLKDQPFRWPVQAKYVGDRTTPEQ